MQKLDITQRQEVKYCIPLWLRDEQVKESIARIKGRLEPRYEKCDDPIAIVCYGPSLSDTWEGVKEFKTVMTCSGSHKFMVDRGIIPTYHVEVDPRPHKVQLIGQPQKETQYLIASTCCRALWNHLEGYDVRLWNVFESEEDGLGLLPRGEWYLTGGCSVGLRAMVVARFLGYTNFHIFGMDGCEGKTGKHADAHPMQASDRAEVEYNGKIYYTTPAFLEAARSTWHELDQLTDVTAKFYGEGLVQDMAKDYVKTPIVLKKDEIHTIGVNKPELISAEYVNLNSQLHRDNLAFGVNGGRHAPVVTKLVEDLNCKSVLDYGCGKGYLGKSLSFPIWEYDPAIPGKDDVPRPADLVVCTDVLEHVEPERLIFVLDDLRRCIKKIGYLVVRTDPAVKEYANGVNTHLIQQDSAWWKKILGKFFEVGVVKMNGPELHIVVGPKIKAKAVA